MYVYVFYMHQGFGIVPSSHEVKITVAMDMCTVLYLYFVLHYVVCCIYIRYEHLCVCTDCVYMSVMAEISAIHFIADTKCTRHSIVPCLFSIAPL